VYLNDDPPLTLGRTYTTVVLEKMSNRFAMDTPALLEETTKSVISTEEWKEATSVLFDSVQHQLAATRTRFFSDLSDPEKAVVIDRAAALVRQSPAYIGLTTVISSSVDKTLGALVASEKDELGNSPTGANKVDRIMDQCGHAAAGLLAKWPDQISRLRACFNQPLPEALRREAWRILLANPPAALAIQRLDTKDLRVSHLEIEIAQRAELLLSTEPRFASLGGGAAHIYVMKSMLSWAQLLGPQVEENDFQLAIPFVYVYAKHQPEPSQRALNTIASLFQWVRTNWLPKVVAARAQNEAAASILTLFEARDLALYRGLKAGLQGAAGGAAGGLAELLRPMVESAFVGQLSIEVSVFIWDQAFLASTAQLDAIKYYCAAVLICLKQMLLPCTTLAAMQHVVKDYTARLTIRQLQGAIDHHFADQMRQELRLGAEREAIPVEDVVLATEQLPQWSAWTGAGPDKRPTAAERAISQQKKDAKKQAKEMAALKTEIKKRREHDAKRIAATRAKRAALEAEHQQLNDIVATEQAKTAEAETKRDAMIATIEMEKTKRLIAEEAISKQVDTVVQTIDHDGDGIADAILIDHDGDGIIDEVHELGENGDVVEGSRAETLMADLNANLLQSDEQGAPTVPEDKTFIAGAPGSASKRPTHAGSTIPHILPGQDDSDDTKVKFSDIFGVLVKTAMFRLEQVTRPSAGISNLHVDAYRQAADGAAVELYGKTVEDLQADNLGELKGAWRTAIKKELPIIYVKQANESGTVEDKAATKIQATYRGYSSRQKTDNMVKRAGAVGSD